MELLNSIRNLGMEYNFIVINATLIINKLNSDIYNPNLLIINKGKLPRFLKDSLF